MRHWLMSIALLGCIQSSSALDLRPTVKEQIEIGQRAAADIRKEYRVLPQSDPRVKLLNELGRELVANIPEAERKRRPFEYTFDVIDSKEVNAVALPGGPIFFFSGIIDRMTTVDQLAGVLGHEIVHVRNQHWASQYADTLKRRIPLAILLELIGANRTVTDVAAIADTILVDLKYSRRHESEADRVGYDLMMGSGYNPQGMADVFRMLAAGAKSDDFAEMLSTHPDPTRRATAIEARLKQERRTLRTQAPLPFPTAAKKAPATSGQAMRAIQQAHLVHHQNHSPGCWCFQAQPKTINPILLYVRMGALDLDDPSEMHAH